MRILNKVVSFKSRNWRIEPILVATAGLVVAGVTLSSTCTEDTDLKGDPSALTVSQAASTLIEVGGDLMMVCFISLIQSAPMGMLYLSLKSVQEAESKKAQKSKKKKKRHAKKTVVSSQSPLLKTPDQFFLKLFHIPRGFKIIGDHSFKEADVFVFPDIHNLPSIEMAHQLAMHSTLNVLKDKFPVVLRIENELNRPLPQFEAHFRTETRGLEAQGVSPILMGRQDLASSVGREPRYTPQIRDRIKTFFKMQFHDRNRDWADSVAEDVKAGKKVAAKMGQNHVLGPDNFHQMLESRGIRVVSLVTEGATLDSWREDDYYHEFYLLHRAQYVLSGRGTLSAASDALDNLVKFFPSGANFMTRGTGYFSLAEKIAQVQPSRAAELFDKAIVALAESIKRSPAIAESRVQLVKASQSYLKFISETSTLTRQEKLDKLRSLPSQAALMSVYDYEKMFPTNDHSIKSCSGAKKWDKTVDKLRQKLTKKIEKSKRKTSRSAGHTEL